MSNVVLVELRPLPGRRVEPRDGLTIGREQCDIALMDRQVSRRHARLRLDSGRLAIEDLGSRNGTFVNDRAIDAPAELGAGDAVQIGETVWQVEAVPGATGASATEASESHGDVPPPPAPSQVARAKLRMPSGAVTGFVEAAPSRRRASAARRVEATMVCYAVILLTAIGVIAYLAAR